MIEFEYTRTIDGIARPTKITRSKFCMQELCPSKMNKEQNAAARWQPMSKNPYPIRHEF